MFEGSNRFHMVELEITRDDSINELKNFIEELLDEKKDLGMKFKNLTDILHNFEGLINK